MARGRSCAGARGLSRMVEQRLLESVQKSKTSASRQLEEVKREGLRDRERERESENEATERGRAAHLYTHTQKRCDWKICLLQKADATAAEILVLWLRARTHAI